MTQKEKYKRAASAMRKALVSIMSDGPSTEYLLRDAKDEIRAALPYEDSDYWRADAPAEGVAVEAEKLETEGEPEKLTRAAVLEKARACVCGEREEDLRLAGGQLRLHRRALGGVSPRGVHRAERRRHGDAGGCRYADGAAEDRARVGTSFVGGTADSFVDLAGYAACGAECAEVTV